MSKVGEVPGSVPLPSTTPIGRAETPSSGEAAGRRAAVVTSGVDNAQTLAKSSQAKGLVAKSGLQSGANAKGLTAGSRFVGAASQAQFGTDPIFPNLSAAQLPTIAQGTAAAWTSVSSLGLSATEALSFVVPDGAQLSVPASDGSVTTLEGPAEIPARLLARWQKAAPQSFRNAMARLRGKQTRLDGATGELVFNPYLAQSRGEALGQASANADPESVEGLINRIVDDEQQGGGQQGSQEGGSEEHEQPHAGEAALVAADDAQTPTAQLVAVADNPQQLWGDVPDSYQAALKATQLPTLQAIGAALTPQASTVFGGSLLSTNAATPYGDQTVSQLLTNTDIPIEDKIFIFMSEMDAKFEDRLKTKMKEIDQQDQAETQQAQADTNQSLADASAAGAAALVGSISTTDPTTSTSSMSTTSSTVQMQELQVMVNQWQQVTTMTSNLMKTLNTMAMTPIQNLR